MPLNPTCELLVNTLEALPTLDDRFESLKLVNYNSATDKTRGCFSLVFSALDRESGRKVALKFFDPERVMDTYRLEAFRREHEILKGLLGVGRCLQVASDLCRFPLQVPMSGGKSIPITCEYFAIEWIEQEIDQYFLGQEKYSAREKIKLFISLTTSIEALHSHEVFHRDLKPDNLRRNGLTNTAQGDVVAIDLGTAAKYTSSRIQPDYSRSVGAFGYAAPETQCGLAGNRRIAKFTDIFALGCMLFELFNKDYYIAACIKANPNYPVWISAMRASISHTNDDRVQLRNWDTLLNSLSMSMISPSLNGTSSDVPPGVGAMLNELCKSLTHVDYRRRPSVAWARARARSALTVLENEVLYQRKLERSRAIRARRVEKARERQNRLELALSVKGLQC